MNAQIFFCTKASAAIAIIRDFHQLLNPQFHDDVALSGCCERLTYFKHAQVLPYELRNLPREIAQRRLLRYLERANGSTPNVKGRVAY